MLAEPQPAGHSMGHAIESAPAPRGSTTLRASQPHGKRSGQLSHSSPFSPPWPAGLCPGCTVAVFPSFWPVVSMLAAANRGDGNRGSRGAGNWV